MKNLLLTMNQPKRIRIGKRYECMFWEERKNIDSLLSNCQSILAKNLSACIVHLRLKIDNDCDRWSEWDLFVIKIKVVQSRMTIELKGIICMNKVDIHVLSTNLNLILYGLGHLGWRRDSGGHFRHSRTRGN